MKINQPQKSKHLKLVGTLLASVFVMFLFAFALVPIYNTLCKQLGVNGKVNALSVREKNAIDKTVNLDASIAKGEPVEVQFVSTLNASVPWKFYPNTQKITMYRGDKVKLSFYAENTTNDKMIVQAIPNVTPGLAAAYIKKTECFCFQRQTLNGHEAMNMPLIFYLDKGLPKKIKTVTLSYTLFDVTKKAS